MMTTNKTTALEQLSSGSLKYICILSLLVAPFVFKPGAALAGGGFSASCL